MSSLEFDFNRAYLLALCSDAAYKNMEAKKYREQWEKSLRMKIHPCESLKYNDHLGIAAFIGTTHDDVVLSFRGTLMEIESFKHVAIAAANWVINVTFSHMKYGSGNAMVHEGFGSVVTRIWDDLRDEVEQKTGGRKRLWVTGHSLGGALASLVANRFYTECKDSVEIAGVYTFGSPRIGNRIFAHECLVPWFRIENGNDPIPHLPPPPSLTLPFQEALREPYERLGEILTDSLALVRRFGGELADLLETFVESLLKWLKNLLGIEYVHAGRLKFIDWDGELVHIDQLVHAKDIAEEIDGTWFDEFLDIIDAKEDFVQGAAEFMNDLSKPFADIARFVRLLLQLVEDLGSGKLTIFADHDRRKYVNSLVNCV